MKKIWGIFHAEYAFIGIRWPKTSPAESVCVLELKRESLGGELTIKARHGSLSPVYTIPILIKSMPFIICCFM